MNNDYNITPVIGVFFWIWASVGIAAAFVMGVVL